MIRRGVLLALLLLGLALPGCIRRYAAPDAPVDPTVPYAALALYRDVDLPVRGGERLPRAALRVAWRDAAVFADAALIDGPEHAAITETVPGARALLQSRRDDPVVLLVSTEDVPAACAAIPELDGRALRATRPEDTPLHPLTEDPEAPEGVSRGPLRGQRLRCPATPAVEASAP